MGKVPSVVHAANGSANLTLARTWLPSASLPGQFPDSTFPIRIHCRRNLLLQSEESGYLSPEKLRVATQSLQRLLGWFDTVEALWCAHRQQKYEISHGASKTGEVTGPVHVHLTVRTLWAQMSQQKGSQTLLWGLRWVFWLCLGQQSTRSRCTGTWRWSEKKTTVDGAA